LLAHRPTPKLEDHPSSAVHGCLFNLFTATLHIGGRSSIRNLRTRNAVVTGTHNTYHTGSAKLSKGGILNVIVHYFLFLLNSFCACLVYFFTLTVSFFCNFLLVMFLSLSLSLSLSLLRSLQYLLYTLSFLTFYFLFMHPSFQHP